MTQKTLGQSSKNLLSNQMVVHHFDVLKPSSQQQPLTKAIAETNTFLLPYIGDGHNSRGEIPSWKITPRGFGLSHILPQGIGWGLNAFVEGKAGHSWGTYHLF